MCKMFFRICIVFFLGSFILAEAQLPAGGPMIRTRSGWVQGSYDTSYSNKTFMRFTGIPYARPPISYLRFKPPQPVCAWRDVYHANITTQCMQIVHVPEVPGGMMDPLGSEDCLHINVFVPRRSTRGLRRRNLDVIVYIHGGAFSFSSGSSYFPEMIMDRNVVYVNFNYRLGIFGFLSMENEALPGNMALRDQIAALQWVQNNIQAFGGNPNNVMITGMSAGAGSVQYLTVSPLARGLFHKAHSMSGSALRMMQTVPYEKAKQVGRAVGCYMESKSLLAACLRTRPAVLLNQAQMQFRPWLYNPIAPFAAIVDDYSPDPVFPKHPYFLLQEKQVADVPFINSMCADEGLYPAAEYVYRDYYLSELDEEWDRLAPAVLNLYEMVPEEDMKNVTDQIRYHYFQDRNISLETFNIVVQMVGDRLYNCDIDLGVRLHAQAISSPVYSYVFDYLIDIGDTSEFLSGRSEKLGVAHGADLHLILPAMEYKYGQYTERDERMKNYLLDMWVNFVRYGKLENWTPVSKEPEETVNAKVVDESYSLETRKIKSLGGECAFWNSLNIRQTS